MKLCFTGLNAPIQITPSSVSVLEVHNRALFARICSSLQSYKGEDAIEPFSLWDSDEKELNAQRALLFVSSPISLPWDEKRLLSGLASKIDLLVLEDLDRQARLEESVEQIRKNLYDLAFLLQSDYSLGVEWDLHRLLKVFNFDIDVDSNNSLLDKCIKFLSYVADTAPATALIFVNLKLFLLENELIELYKQAFFLNLKVLLVENIPDSTQREEEKKYIIDQDFLESWQ